MFLVASTTRPSCRYWHTAVILKTEMLIFGGLDVNGNKLNDLWSLNLLTLTTTLTVSEIILWMCDRVIVMSCHFTSYLVSGLVWSGLVWPIFALPNHVMSWDVT